jgi:aspartate kinase
MARIIVKFGGSSVADGEKVRNAARSIVKTAKEGNEVAVVVSAMGKTTNALIEAMEVSTEGKYTPKQKDDITGMGERTSVRVLSASINSLGVESVYIDPGMKEWPTKTDSNFVNAKIDLEETRKRAMKHIDPLLKKGVVPVICGFLGVDDGGNVTTIGRGGSDTTAVMLGNCLDADEVAIVTDVDGVFSGDPRVVDDARLISEIDVSVLWDLAVAGAKVMKWDSLVYKNPNTTLKIVNNRHRDLSAAGTEIKGEFMETKVSKLERPLGSITLVGKNIIEYAGLLSKTSEILGKEGVNVWGVTVAPDSMSYFINEDHIEKATKLLHEFVLKDEDVVSVTSSKEIGLVYVTSPDFLDQPGALGDITSAIAKAGINIKEVTTSKSQIMVFVDYNRLDEVYEIMSLLFDKCKK